MYTLQHTTGVVLYYDPLSDLTVSEDFEKHKVFKSSDAYVFLEEQGFNAYRYKKIRATAPHSLVTASPIVEGLSFRQSIGDMLSLEISETKDTLRIRRFGPSGSAVIFQYTHPEGTVQMTPKAVSYTKEDGKVGIALFTTKFDGQIPYSYITIIEVYGNEIFIDMRLLDVSVEVIAMSYLHDMWTVLALQEENILTYIEIPSSTLSFKENIVQKEFSVYPNPTDDVLYITGQEATPSTIVVNAVGQRFPFVGSAQILQTQHLPPGLYFLTIGTTTVPFVKK